MLSKEVLQLLGISRPTLTKYVKTGLIRATELPNKRYDYNLEDVFKLFNKGVERKTYLYARVSTQKWNAVFTHCSRKCQGEGT